MVIECVFQYILNEITEYNSNSATLRAVNCKFLPPDAPDNTAVLMQLNNVDMDYTGGVNEGDFIFRSRNVNYNSGIKIAKDVLSLFAGQSKITLPIVKGKRYLVFSCPFHQLTQLPADDKNRFIFESRFNLRYEEI